MALEHQTLLLADGRVMGYALYGNLSGLPILVCHGTPGSRLMLRLADGAARDLGLCIIAPDRPGYGFSSRRTGWRLSDWADDVAALADALGIEQFAMVGISGGGPFAFACCRKLPERIRLAVLVSAVGPMDEALVQRLEPRQQTMIQLARCSSLVLRVVLRLGGRGLRRLPASALARIIGLVPGTETLLKAKPCAREDMIASFREAFRKGGSGVADDLAFFSHPWGFSVRQITVPAMLWHGEADVIVPVAMGRYLASELRNCTATFIPNAGHYWIIEHIDTVLLALRKRLVDEP
jgi:pimeloyl-ACP methyl ester carboxylesterase